MSTQDYVDYGTVDFEGATYKITTDAVADNYGTDGEIVYKARAEDNDGNEYQVYWPTLETWDKAQERLEVEALLRQARRDREEMDIAVLEDRLAELSEYDGGEDESEACDWENPFKVVAL